jgi:hypothetical protein
MIHHKGTKGIAAWNGFKISVATKDHIRLRQGFGGQEEHRERPFFELYVTFPVLRSFSEVGRGKKSD